MQPKTYIWKGPHTAVEVWDYSKGDEGTLVFSGQVTPGVAIPVPLDGDNPAVASWRAFNLVEEAPSAPASKEKNNA